jgi:hypothetical protein
MMAMMPPMPEKEGEIYHIVAMDWFRTWKHYTGFNKVKILPNGTHNDSMNGDSISNVTMSTA